MSTTILEDQLQRSIIYRRLIDDLERLVVGEWSASEKQRMVGVINESVGQVVSAYVYRCGKCDSDDVFIQCVGCKQAGKVN